MQLPLGYLQLLRMFLQLSKQFPQYLQDLFPLVVWNLYQRLQLLQELNQRLVSDSPQLTRATLQLPQELPRGFWTCLQLVNSLV